MSGPLRKYKVTRGGVETVMKLNDDDAKRLGVSVDQALDAAPTIQTVELAADEADSEADDGTAGDDATDGADADEGDGDGSVAEGAAAAEAQSTPDSGGDGQAPAPQDSPKETTATATAKKAAAKKTAAKRQPASANKARTSAATKATDGGS